MNGDLEKELREALARVEPPGGFTGRVFASLPEERGRTRPYWFIIAAAALVLVLFARFEQEQYEARRQAARVQQQVTFAFRLTAERLAAIDGRLKRSAPDLQVNREKGEL